MTRPAVPAVTETWYAETAVTQPGDEQRGWPWLIFLGGLGHAFGQVHDLVRDTDDGPGWSNLLDPGRCPTWALPWLAQFAGVRLTPGAGDAQWREEITTPPPFVRGTPAAMRDAAQRTLTGTKHVSLIERNASAYRLSVITRTSETPDPAATERAVRAQKPAGLVLTFSVVDGEAWDEATSTWDAPAVTWDNATSV